MTYLSAASNADTAAMYALIAHGQLQDPGLKNLALAINSLAQALSEQASTDNRSKR